MAEISLAILVVGVLFIADPDRLQLVLDRIRDRCSILKIFGSYPRFPVESLGDAIDPVQPID